MFNKQPKKQFNLFEIKFKKNNLDKNKNISPIEILIEKIDPEIIIKQITNKVIIEKEKIKKTKVTHKKQKMPGERLLKELKTHNPEYFN